VVFEVQVWNRPKVQGPFDLNDKKGRKGRKGRKGDTQTKKLQSFYSLQVILIIM